MLAERITNSFLVEGIISDEEKEVIQYGLESLGGNLLSIVLTLAVGACFGQIEDAVLLWLFLFPLRKNAGGFHAETRTGCLFLSAAMLILSFALYTVIIPTVAFYGISLIVTGMMIWLLAPVENPSKRLDDTEYRIYRRRSRLLLASEGVIFIVAWWIRWNPAMGSIAMALFIVALSLVMGRLKTMKRDGLGQPQMQKGGKNDVQIFEKFIIFPFGGRFHFGFFRWKHGLCYGSRQ